jgi:homoserine O-acetyltransferase
VSHLRLVIGNSMGGMHTWLWGERYPDFMDALAPMAAQPTAMSSRNWMMRRLIIDAISARTRTGRTATTPASRKP